MAKRNGTAAQAVKDLKQFADHNRAQHAQKFFKTAWGEYSEGDRFLGVCVPEVRKVARDYKALDLEQIEHLLHSPLHEIRLLALVILVAQFKQAQRRQQQSRVQERFEFYLANIAYVNNWDLVDTSCRDIIGAYLLDQPNSCRKILYDFARSTDLWRKRIAIISTWRFIRRGQLDDTIKLARLLIHDEHDLIHKAVGWMLRDVGEQNRDVLLNFLTRNGKRMPRTTLRYAIEKLPQAERRHWLATTR